MTGRGPRSPVDQDVIDQDVRETEMSDANVTKLSLDDLRELFQAAGFRVETVTDPVAGLAYLRSATGGLAFDVRPGNRIAGTDDIVDLALVAPLQVQGELPLEIVNRWNLTRRFARLQLGAPFLVFSMDLVVLGGVSRAFLRGQIEMWDRLVQELVVYLRDELGKLAKPAPAAPVAAEAPVAAAAGGDTGRSAAASLQ
jgi:hypothetical protein